MSQTQVETFRVYTGVLRVGVRFRVGSLRLQWFSFLILAAAVIGTGLLLFLAFVTIPGVWAAVVGALIFFAGLLTIFVILVAAIRWQAMSPEVANLRESTQFRLLRETTTARWHLNFETPDDHGADIIRNY